MMMNDRYNYVHEEIDEIFWYQYDMRIYMFMGSRYFIEFDMHRFSGTTRPKILGSSPSIYYHMIVQQLKRSSQFSSFD